MAVSGDYSDEDIFFALAGGFLWLSEPASFPSLCFKALRRLQVEKSNAKGKTSEKATKHYLDWTMSACNAGDGPLSGWEDFAGNPPCIFVWRIYGEREGEKG